MKKLIIFVLIITLSTLTSCFKDLDTAPLDPNLYTSGTVFNSPDSYKQFLAKLYAGLAVSGQEGPSGQSDISGIDEGFGQYLRGYWYHQQLPTDEALIGWNDQTIWDFHDIDWTPADGFTYAFYSRIFYQISVCNEFLRETTDAKLDERGVDANLKREIADYRAEARFLRALSYWHALDLFRNVPFVTENDIVGSFFPRQAQAQEVFNYIESELLAIENVIKPPKGNEYGRADQGAVWTLLAKLYLNAEVYTGQKKYNESLTYCEKVISGGYSLEPNYSHLFLADNHRSNEIIFPIAFDGNRTRTWGGMTFIIRAGIGGTINPLASGVSGGWGGTRTTRQFVEKFPSNLTGIIVNYNYSRNQRAIYMPGTLNGFNGTDDKNKLASLGSNNVFEGYRYFPEDGMEFVILRNPSSTLSGKLGDNEGDGKLETNGANIKVPGRGLYYIRVDLTTSSNLTYTMERRDFEVTGSAVPGGSKDVVWDDTEKKLRYVGELAVGSFTLREKSDKVSYGDAQRDAIIESTGAFVVEKSGGHDILFDMTRPDYTYQMKLTSFDRRGIFGTQGQALDIPTYQDIGIFTNGYAVLKFKNVTSTGQTGANVDFPDTDFPMFRLGDVYLMAAEAILRGAPGGASKALEYFNAVRTRAYTGTAGNVSSSELNLDLILDERARELYWECHRRTDLVRFNKFTTADYLWAWKGGEANGRAVDSKYNIFPIPSADRSANPNLEQNPGY